MKPGISLRIGLMCGLLLGLGLIAPAGFGQSNPFQEAFENPECQQWCWLGIEPGATTRAELEAILAVNGIVYVTAELDEMKFYTIYWGIDNPNYLFPFAERYNTTIIYTNDYTNKAGVVDQIWTDVTNLPVETALGYMDRPPDAIRHVIDPRIIYRDTGFVLGIDSREPTEVAFITIYSLELIDFGLSNPDTPDLQPCTEPANLCSIATASPKPNPFEEAFENPECQQWCWLGIEPGVTTRAGLEAILAANRIGYVTADNPFDDYLIYTIYWGINNPDYLFPFAKRYNATIIQTNENGIVTQILTDVTDLPVETALGYMNRQPDAIVDYFNPLIVYRNMGFIIEVDAENYSGVISFSLNTLEGIDIGLSNPNMQDLQPCTEPANLCSIPTAKPHIATPSVNDVTATVRPPSD